MADRNEQNGNAEFNQGELANMTLQDQHGVQQTTGKRRVQRAYHNLATGAPNQTNNTPSNPTVHLPSAHPSQDVITSHPDHHREDLQSFRQPQQQQTPIYHGIRNAFPNPGPMQSTVPAHFGHGQGAAAYLDTAGASGTGLAPPAQNGWDQGGALGPKLQGPRPKLDVDRIPSIVGIRDEDRQRHTGRYFMTCGEEPPPLATTDFAAVDQGNSNPKFLRFTTSNFPMNQEQVSACDVPMAAILQPFANLRQDENPVPLVRTGPEGPIRCQRCRAYLNAWCQIERGGTAFVCNLCAHLNHFSSQVNGIHGASLVNFPSRDTNPELQFGTVDYTVGEDYHAQPPDRRIPQPISILFVIDVSEGMIGSSALSAIGDSIHAALYPGSADQSQATADYADVVPAGARIGFMTYSKTLHFYRFEPSMTRPQLMIVSEIDDAFVPFENGLFCDPQQNKEAIIYFLKSMRNFLPDGVTNKNATGAACRAAYLALRRSGGHIFLLTSSIPNSGPGALEARDTKAGYNPEQEKVLLRPQSNYYETTGMELAEAGIGLDLLLFPLQYVDMPSMALLSSISGGEIMLYPRFSIERHGEKLDREVQMLLRRLRGYDVTMRMRCSSGVRVSKYLGGYHQRTVTDIDMGSITSQKAIVILLQHENKLDPKTHVYFQSATLHTTTSGERRVRIHNAALTITNMLANIYKYACIDATITVVFKDAVSRISTTPLAEIRKSITTKCTKIMTSYRKHCASASSQAQLILPESLKSYILLSLAMLKSVALQGSIVFSDLRIYSASFASYHGVAVISRMLYPQLLALPEPGVSAEEDLVQEVRLSKNRLRPDRLYLLITSEHALLWFGENAHVEQLYDLLGIQDIAQITSSDIRLRHESAWLQWIQTVIAQSITDSPRHLNVILARKEVDAAYLTFTNALIEDANNDAFDYVDYLCLIHRQIQQELGL